MPSPNLQSTNLLKHIQDFVKHIMSDIYSPSSPPWEINCKAFKLYSEDTELKWCHCFLKIVFIVLQEHKNWSHLKIFLVSFWDIFITPSMSWSWYWWPFHLKVKVPSSYLYEENYILSWLTGILLEIQKGSTFLKIYI